MGSARGHAGSRLARVPPLASLLLVGSIACAPRALLHTNGAPLAPGFEPIPIEGGWVGFDECAGGIHAIVEIEIAQPAGGGAPSPRALRLALSERDVSAPRSASISGPFCMRRSEVWSPGLGEPRPAESDEPISDGTRPDRDCIYAIRAQFLLSHLPAAGEAVAILWDGRVVRFARR